MRIIIEADSVASDKMSGIGHATYEIINTLNKKIGGTKHQLIAVVPYGRKRYIKKYSWNNVQVRQLPPGYKYVNFLLVRTSLPIPVDLLFGRGVYVFPNYKNWYVPFSRSITFVHDVAYRLFPETTHPKNLVYLNANFDRWLRRTDTIVSISKQSSREVEQAFPVTRGRITTIYLGVDQTLFYPRKKAEVIAIRKEYGIKDDYFLIVGNIEPRKNIERALDAYKMYSDKSPSPAQLVIVGGDGWKNEAILDKITSLRERGYDIYRPARYVEDDAMPMLYSGARSILHIAIHEGFGLPPAESQACGAPVIASDIPVLREILNPATVKFIDPFDVAGIAEAMLQTKPSRGLRRPSIKPSLTWGSTVDDLLKIAGIIEG